MLADGVGAHSADLVEGRLPPNCLLMMAVTAGGELRVEWQEPPATPEDDAGQVQDEEFASTVLRVALDDAKRQVLIEGLPPVKGAKTFHLFALLADRYRADLAAGRAPENFSIVRSADLATALQTEEPSLRKLVSRTRRRVFRQYEARHGIPLSQQALIENVSWHGYRLNPAVRLLDPSQLRAA